MHARVLAGHRPPRRLIPTAVVHDPDGNVLTIEWTLREDEDETVPALPSTTTWTEDAAAQLERVPTGQVPVEPSAAARDGPVPSALACSGRPSEGQAGVAPPSADRSAQAGPPPPGEGSPASVGASAGAAAGSTGGGAGFSADTATPRAISRAANLPWPGPSLRPR